MPVRGIFFDRQDHELLRMVNSILERRRVQAERDRELFASVLHPHGIIEMATTHEQRVAYAVINLLGSLEQGMARDRLAALRALHDEVLHSARTIFRYNTGRVLIQIMKGIVRARGDEFLQLKLAHDFRLAASGNPRIIRSFLKRYHLLEMPEQWDQLTMDHHVHDSNTKGRKNPTHRMMDSWIKGIRFLTLIYYNYVTPEAAQEALEAARIVGISLRVGLEYRTTFKKRFVSFVWVPRGFTDSESFAAWMAEPQVACLLEKGKKASAWLAGHVLATLEKWNNVHRLSINHELGVDIQPLEKEQFLNFVGVGQPSFLHLAEMLHHAILPDLAKRYTELEEELEDMRKSGSAADDSEHAAKKKAIRSRMSYLDGITPEIVLNFWLKSEVNPDLPSSRKPRDDADFPEILSMRPEALVNWLASLRGDSHICLNLSGLSADDVLEILWDCRGLITHLETFNLKDWQEGKAQHLAEISRLHRAINAGNPLRLKQIILTMLKGHEDQDIPNIAETREKLYNILHNIAKFQDLYKIVPLRSRIGTDSTSHSSMRHGMGIVVPQTLPAHTRLMLRRERSSSRIRLPVRVNLFQRVSYVPKINHNGGFINALLGKLYGFRHFAVTKKVEWVVQSDAAYISDKGNTLTMGGIVLQINNGFSAQSKKYLSSGRLPDLSCLNTTLGNSLKVILSFIITVLSFLYTQDWFFMVWFGPVIWYVMTALRNVLQALISGGALRYSTLLHWNDYVNWARLCDSLMYTGISVPLLEILIRKLLLEKVLGMTVDANPFWVFGIISTANGLYIAAHNAYRGFPKEAIVGNLFRSIFAIPLSIIYHNAAVGIFILAGVPDPLVFLQSAATIISKAASDTVAGIIEGIADKNNNLRLRKWDFKTKLAQLYNDYMRMEITYPDQDVAAIMKNPKAWLRFLGDADKKLQTSMIIDALDLMYFWMYLPRAQQVFRMSTRAMPKEERILFARTQLVLLRVKEVSQLFVDGLVGKNFSLSLAFYLNRHEEYIRAVNRVCGLGHEKGETDADDD
jgi:hypothetical protein